MIDSRARHHAWTALLTGLLAALPMGCASSRPGQEGIRIGDETLKQFEAGVTTEAWLVAILGKPTSWAVVDGVRDTKVFRYATGESNAGLSSIVTGSQPRNTAVTYFIISEGLVTRFWADRATEHTLLGSPVEKPEGEKQTN